MLVKYYADLTYDKVSEVDLTCSNAVEALALLASVIEPEFTKNFATNKYYIILQMQDDTLLQLSDTMIGAEFNENVKALLVVPEIEGDFELIAAGIAYVAGVSLPAAGTAFAAYTAAQVAVYVAAAVVMVGISYGLSMIMQALSPSQSYSNNTNPARTKASNLFNSRNMVRNQGGSVPVIFGNPHCSGVLIASGLTTEAI